LNKKGYLKCCFDLAKCNLQTANQRHKKWTIWPDFFIRNLMVEFILYSIENFLIALVLIPAVILCKIVLFVRLADEPQVDLSNFFFFSHPNVATTHDRHVRSKKNLQNMLSITVFFLILLQLVLAVPVFMK
jgi:hypothetical protein